ncbi:MAG: hypothetical protein HFF38_09335 [Lawsonibacter sp.]|nr:hypothetical protein [Lawsonibacter sp.]
MNKMKKKFVFLIMLSILLCSIIISAGAVEQIYQETEIIYTEFGVIEKVSVMTVHNSPIRSNTRFVDVSDTYKYNGKVIGEVTLSVTFGYDGNKAWVSSASGSHTTYDGWSYGSEDIKKSGGTASLTAKLSHLLYRDLSVNISITCSPTGQVS